MEGKAGLRIAYSNQKERAHKFFEIIPWFLFFFAFKSNPRGTNLMTFFLAI
jgi:hypothetical protein